MTDPLPTDPDQLTTLLFTELGTHLDAGAALVSYSHGLANALGAEVLAAFTHLLEPYQSSAHLLRIYQQMLTTADDDPTSPAAGGGDAG
ncbi:hypothetical protein ACIHDR_41625 [Nocardia sp. NPDC052278]|uniref:hypothetical protein n=1 Tax=unclassified Nocardia TaxID=2637762 RepID=UPI003678E7FD